MSMFSVSPVWHGLKDWLYPIHTCKPSTLLVGLSVRCDGQVEVRSETCLQPSLAWPQALGYPVHTCKQSTVLVSNEVLGVR